MCTYRELTGYLSMRIVCLLKQYHLIISRVLNAGQYQTVGVFKYRKGFTTVLYQ